MLEDLPFPNVSIYSNFLFIIYYYFYLHLYFIVIFIILFLGVFISPIQVQLVQFKYSFIHSFIHSFINFIFKTGLFTADQNVNQDKATHTRQNPGGTRRGLECPEERDYFPYWHPSGWKDIVVLTKRIDQCDFIKKESFNVKPKGQYSTIPL